MKRVLVLVSLLAAGCGGTSDVPDAGAGAATAVDVTVTLAPGLRESIANVTVMVTGAEQGSRTLTASEFSGNDGHFRYRPRVQSGQLFFSGEAKDSKGTVIASGSSGAVALVTGAVATVTVEVVATKKAAGASCAKTEDCLAGMTCLDGVCCKSSQCAPCLNCGDQGECNEAILGPDLTGCPGPDKTCDALGACKSVLGRLCTEAAECESGHCVDGVCCGVPGCDECRNCDGSGACVLVADGEQDLTGNCHGTKACSAIGTCLSALGQACSVAGECASGHCVDGVCCGVSKCGACTNCGSTGACDVVVDGGDDLTGDVCIDNATCKAGACLKELGQACTDKSQCLSGNCVDGVCCGNSSCPECMNCGAAGSCTVAIKGGPDATGCSGTKTCDGAGACKLALGTSCTDAADCINGFCVDGVCCGTASCPQCTNCGASGICSVVVSNAEDPTGNACVAPKACGAAGNCDLAPGQPCSSGTTCASGNCEGGFCCASAACPACANCDATGACSALVLNGDDLSGTACTGAKICDAAGACKLELGQGCSSDGDCASGHCLDGFCCGSASCPECMNCDATGSCNAPIEGKDSTGTACDGSKICTSGACMVDLGAGCSGASDCASGICLDGVCCNVGSCEQCKNCGATGDCTVAVLSKDDDSGNACEGVESCNASGQCKSGLGQPCGYPGACASGNCVDGRCCDSSACPACMNCGTSGTCDVPVLSAVDSTGAVCSGANACDASGACKKVLGETCSSGDECVSGNCVDGFCCDVAACPPCLNASSTGACDVTIVGAEDSSGTACSGASACDASGACKLKLGRTCGDGSQCASGYCADGVCCDAACDEPCYACSAAGACETILFAEEEACKLTASSGLRICDASGVCQAPRLLKDIATAASASSWASGFAGSSGNKVFFGANDGANGRQLWVTDGTTAGTRMVQQLHPTNALVTGLVAVNDVAYFVGADSTGYTKLLKSDGASISVVKDIWPGSNSVFPWNAARLVQMNGIAYFSACTATHGCELWRTDGSEPGTYMVKDILTAPAFPGTTNSMSSSPAYLTVMGNALYFAASSTTMVAAGNTVPGYPALWKSDGTAEGTVAVLDVANGMANRSPMRLTAVPTVSGDRLMFTAGTGIQVGNTELYVTDGNVGNFSVVTVQAVMSSYADQPLAVAANRAFFPATNAAGNELWVTDGTVAGTGMVQDISPLGNSSYPRLLTPAGENLYFWASYSNVSNSIFRVAGVNAWPVANVNPFGNASAMEMAYVANRLYIATNSAQYNELWVSDGTAAPALRACPSLDACGAHFPRNPSQLTAVGNRLYFNAQATTPANASLGGEPFVFP